MQVTEADFAPAAAQLPALSAAWLAAEKQKLAKGIVLSSFTDIRTAADIARPDDLDLAVSVFVCSEATDSCGGSQTAPRVCGVWPKDKLVPFVGMSEVLLHERKHREDAEPRTVAMAFSERGCLAALALLVFLGLDAQTVRPTDVDALKARLQCAHCVSKRVNTLAKVVMDWRRCVRMVSGLPCP